MSASKKPPRYPDRPHQSGQARIVVNGRHIYLGPWGSPESRERYAQVCAELARTGRLAQPPASGSGQTVGDVTVAYLAYCGAQPRYRDTNGKATMQLGHICRALDCVQQLHASTLATDFGPRALLAVRQTMVGRGWGRDHINRLTSMIQRAFRWAVSEELISATVSHALDTVEPLQRGEAPERKKVQPVLEDVILATLPWLTPPVRAMVQLQRFSACRSGEVVVMTTGRIERSSGTVWVYRPERHKTLHHGHERLIYLGPQAQEVLATWLQPDAPDAFLFSPRAEMERRVKEAKSHRPAKRRTGRLREHFGECYSVTSYAHAIARAIARANTQGAAIPHWHPHMLRHLAGTIIVREFGWDLARIVLGHRHVNVTRLYAEDNTSKAIEAIRKIG